MVFHWGNGSLRQNCSYINFIMTKEVYSFWLESKTYCDNSKILLLQMFILSFLTFPSCSFLRKDMRLVQQYLIKKRYFFVRKQNVSLTAVIVV